MEQQNTQPVSKLMDFLGRFVPAIVGFIGIAVWWNLEGLSDSVSLPGANATVTLLIKITTIGFLYILLILGVMMVLKSVSLFVEFFRGK